MYKLWLDDDANKPGMEDWRSPPKDDTDWRVARSTKEAQAIVLEYGPPIFMELDHDLGLDEFGRPDTAIDFLKWLEQSFPAAIDSLLGFHVHSMNPGKDKDIQAFLHSWAKVRALL